MTDEQLKLFLERVNGDETLQVSLKAAGYDNAVVAIARGF